MGPFPHDAPPATITADNPMGTDGFEFVEYAHPNPQELHALFKLMGYAPVARHKTKKITVYRQGDINYLVNEEPGTHGYEFVAAHGPCAPSMAFRVVDATAAYDRAIALGAERNRTVIGRRGIDDAKRHRRRTGAVGGDELIAVSAGLLVDEIVDVALAIDRDLLGLVPRDGRIAHQLEQSVQLLRIGVGVFDELESVGAHRVVGSDRGRRCIVRKRSHGVLPNGC